MLEKIMALCCFVILLNNSIEAQECSLGDPVFSENFGLGTSRLGSSLNQDPITNVHPNFRPADLYEYVGSGGVSWDQYSIMKNPKDAAPQGADWNDDFPDHTPDNIDNGLGYMYYCDAFNDLKVFYAQKLEGLCPNIEYELSAWFAKTNAPDYYIDPNIKLIIGFTDINDDTIGSIVETDTGSIEGDGVNRWHRKSLIFAIPTDAENIYFMLKNNVAGSAGNDLVIDDIEVRPCGPKLEITNQIGNNIINSIQCIDEPYTQDISLSANIPDGFVMQWQESVNDGIWTNIINETTSILNYSMSLESNSLHSFRIKFAHSLDNFLNNSCNFNSQEIIYNKMTANEINNFAISNVSISETNTITVDMISSNIKGDYYFQLDNGDPQRSNIFENVLAGPRLITVIDASKCNAIYKEVLVFDVPKYVTPNNDGYFDTWQIKGIQQIPNSIIYIHDRYGKLIKALPNTSMGWDGTFNGLELQADDYWYITNISFNEEDYQLKGHFTLKR